MTRDEYGREFDYMDEVVKELDMPSCFGHNDIHEKNVLYDAETGKYSLCGELCNSKVLVTYVHKVYSSILLFVCTYYIEFCHIHIMPLSGLDILEE